MRRAISLIHILAVASLMVAVFPGNVEATKEHDPYKKPEVTGKIIKVRDLLLNGSYKKAVAECRRAQEIYPDLLVWNFSAMLAPQARMLELHDWSLEKDYLSGWNKLTELAERVRCKRRFYAYDHLCLGGGLGIYGLHHARAGNFRRAFSLGVGALRELGKAKQADPECQDLYMGYGIYHYYRGVLSHRFKWLPFFADDKRRGLEELERARKGLFGEPLVDLAKIYLYKDEGKWAKGIELTRKLRRSYPSSKLLVQHEGYFLFRLGKFNAAIREFDNVLASDPKNGPVHLYRGAALFRLKRLKLAEKECRACINLPSTPFYKSYAYYFLGKIAIDRGDDALAEKYWKEALRIYPGNKKAKIALLMLQRKRVLEKR